MEWHHSMMLPSIQKRAFSDKRMILYMKGYQNRTSKGSHFLCLRFCAYSHFLVSTVLVPTKLLPTLGCLLFFCPHLWKWRFCAYHLVFDSFIPTGLLPAYSCPPDGKGRICAYPLVGHVFVPTSLAAFIWLWDWGLWGWLRGWLRGCNHGLGYQTWSRGLKAFIRPNTTPK